MSKIIDYLYLGDLNDSSDYDFLTNNNIKTIINLTTFKNEKIYDNIKYYNIQMLDSPDQPILYVIHCVNDIIEKNKFQGNILVHCYVGKSRSASCVIAYIMYLSNFKYDVNNILIYVKNLRPIVQPNDGFMKQLYLYYKNNTNNDDNNKYKYYNYFVGFLLGCFIYLSYDNYSNKYK